jgi:hypothetical protein
MSTWIMDEDPNGLLDYIAQLFYALFVIVPVTVAVIATVFAVFAGVVFVIAWVADKVTDAKNGDA